MEKLTCGKNRTSFKRRILHQTCLDKQTIKRMLVLLPEVDDSLMWNDLLGYDDPVLETIANELINITYDCEHFQPEAHTILRPYTIRKSCTSIDNALEHCGPHGESAFVHRYLFRVTEMRKLHSLLFPDPIKLEKRGQMYSEELLLLVCGRYRHVMATVADLGYFHGRDASCISAFFRAALDHLSAKFGHLLALDRMDRFRDFLPNWNASFSRKFQEKCGIPLPGRWSAANVTLDGIRLQVAKPTQNIAAVVNPYIGNLPTLVFIAIVGGNGMVVGLSAGWPGRQNDPAVLSLLNVEQHLQNAGMIAICDSIFSHTMTTRPIPKANQTMQYSPQQLNAVSSVRVSIEWAFGELTTKMPFLIQYWKQKVYHTCPAKTFQVGVLLSNLRRCLEGGNALTYFDEEIIDVESYLAS